MVVWACLFFASVVYAAFNFMFTIRVLAENCTPEIIDGEFAMTLYGKLVKVISEDEFIRQQIFQTRLHSGHWMMFILPIIATIYNKMTKPGRSL